MLTFAVATKTELLKTKAFYDAVIPRDYGKKSRAEDNRRIYVRSIGF